MGLMDWIAAMVKEGARPRATSDFNAVSTSRRVSSWLPSNSGANTLVFSHAEQLRAKSRDMARKNGWAAHALDVYVADAIGTGITPICGHSDQAVRDEFSQVFLKWTDEADANQTTDFYGIQAQAVRAIMQDGECFVRVRRRMARDKMTVPLQLQLLEADYVPLLKNEQLENGESIKGGIEFNALGQRTAYHMFRNHPGEMFGLTSGDTARIPASEVFHLFRPIRPGQVRGLPWFTPVLTKLFDLDQCDDAALMRMKIANMLTLIIKRPPSNFTGPLNETDAGDGTGDATLEPGMTMYLEEGEEPWNSSPPDAGAAYDPFIKAQLRAVAAGLGLTYSKLTGDNTQENFSSMRGGELGYRRMVETFQHQTIIWQLCRPLLPIFLQQAMLAGSLKTRPVEEYMSTEWQPPVWPWVDPLHDIEAAQMEVRAGFNSRSRIAASRGYNAEQIDREQAADNARADAAGVKYDSDGRQAKTSSGQQKQEQQKAGAGQTGQNQPAREVVQ